MVEIEVEAEREEGKRAEDVMVEGVEDSPGPVGEIEVEDGDAEAGQEVEIEVCSRDAEEEGRLGLRAWLKRELGA